GAASRVAPDATAFRPRAFPYAPIIVSQWLDPAKTSENIAWARDCWGALQPFAGGVYVNDLGENDEERVPTAYGSNYQRLAALKKKDDPHHVFRLNPNIKPAARSRRHLHCGPAREYRLCGSTLTRRIVSRYPAYMLSHYKG